MATCCRPWCAFCFILVAVLHEATAKVQQVQLRFGRDDRQVLEWQYVGKFGYDVGKGSYSVRLREGAAGSVPPGTSLGLELYLDEDWEHAESVTDVCRKRASAKGVRDIAIGKAGDWGMPKKGTVIQNVRPHVWYFALADCSGRLSNGTYSFDLELEFLQAGGSHFSVELRWAPSANLLTLVGCGAFIVNFWRRSRQFSNLNGALHPVIWTLGFILCAQYVAQCMHTGHLALYRVDGQGSWFLEVSSEVLFVLCQMAQTFLLVIIALGYTLLRGDLGDLDAVLPVCGLVALAHAALVILDKAGGDTAHRFTDHDGLTGLSFFGLRLGLYAWFVWAAKHTSSRGGLKLKAFMEQFRTAASMYFLAYPLAFLLMQIVAPYWRETVMETGLMVAQVVSNVWLANLFLDRGAYFQASSLSASPLPSTASPAFFKTD